jgi:hypothetical protein
MTVQQQTESPRHIGIGHKQQAGNCTAGQGHQQLDAQKMRGQLPFKKTRQPRAHAHGEQVATNDGGELQDRVAQQVGRQRPGRQLVHQAAGGHHKYAG